MSKEYFKLAEGQKQSLTAVKDSIVSGEENVDVSLIHLIQNVAGFTDKDGRSKECEGDRSKRQRVGWS